MPFLRSGISVLALLLCAAGAIADPLDDRNIPPGKLLFVDDTGTYYGVYTGDYLADPNGVGIDPQVVKLSVLAFREPKADGTLIEVTPLRIIDGNGNEVDGYSYDNSEIELVNNHISPAVERLFPNRRWKDSITMLYFAADEYYSNGYALGMSDDPDIEDAEQPITRLGFIRTNGSAPFRPGYESRGLIGDPVDWIRRGTQDNPTSRKRLPNSVVERRTGMQAEKVARFIVDPTNSDQTTGINNPDGMYLVGLSGRVAELRLFRERDKDGSYAVDAYSTVSGKKTIDGWWYPDSQQFWAKELITMPGNEQCNQMSEHRWTHSVVPSTRLAEGRTISIFTESSAFSSKREPRTCVNARLNPNTCEIQSCNRYERLPPRFVIVEHIEDARAVGLEMSKELKRKCENTTDSSFALQFCHAL